MDRYEASFLRLIAGEDLARELDETQGMDRTVRASFHGALRAKAHMMAITGLWHAESDERLDELLLAWTRRHLRRTLRPGEAYGYGPLSLTAAMTGSDGARLLTVTAQVSALTDTAPRGGRLVLRSLPPLPLVQATTDCDAQTHRVEATLTVPLTPMPVPEAGDPVVEAIFLGYDLAYTDGRLHGSVVQVALLHEQPS